MYVYVFYLPLPKDLGILFAYTIHLLSKYILYFRFMYICTYIFLLRKVYNLYASPCIHLFIQQISIEHQVNCMILELEGTYAVILLRTLNLGKRYLGS